MAKPNRAFENHEGRVEAQSQVDQREAVQADLELGAAERAMELMTPQKLLEMNRQMAELKKQLETKNTQRKEMEAAPEVDKQAILRVIFEALQFVYPEKDFRYEVGYLAQGLANSATFLGRNRKARKKTALAKRKAADDMQLHGVAEVPAGLIDIRGNMETVDGMWQADPQGTGLEVPQTEKNRRDAEVSRLNLSLMRTKAVQQVCAYIYTQLSGQPWTAPATLEERRQAQRVQSPDSRGFMPEVDADPEF